MSYILAMYAKVVPLVVGQVIFIPQYQPWKIILKDVTEYLNQQIQWQFELVIPNQWKTGSILLLIILYLRKLFLIGLLVIIRPLLSQRAGGSSEWCEQEELQTKYLVVMLLRIRLRIAWKMWNRILVRQLPSQNTTSRVPQPVDHASGYPSSSDYLMQWVHNGLEGP